MMWCEQENKKLTETFNNFSPIQIAEKTYKYPLLYNPHMMLLPPTVGETYYGGFDIIYFHTGCDETNGDTSDWDDGYRTLQTACSLVLSQLQMPTMPVPSILEIQQTLLISNCKEIRHVGSNDVIGALDAFFVLRRLYKVRSQYVHISRTQPLTDYVDKIKQYFKEYSGFIIMDTGFCGKCMGIAAIHIDQHDQYLLLIKSNFIGIPKSYDELFSRGYVKWVPIATMPRRNYDLCFLQVRKQTVHNDNERDNDNENDNDGMVFT